MKVKNILGKFINNPYLKLKEKPILEDHILLEDCTSNKLSSDLFAMIRKLCAQDEALPYKIIYVSTKENEEKAKARFAFYGYNIVFVIRGSLTYKKYLATCKYLVNEGNFPSYFLKRDDQIYLKVGQSATLLGMNKQTLNKDGLMARMQKNYLMCDYIQFSNTVHKDIVFKQYMLEHLYKGDVVFADHPRNEVFLQDDKNLERRAKLQLEHQRIIAYIPYMQEDLDEEINLQQRDEVEAFFKEIDQSLKKDEVFYVLLHPTMERSIDFMNYTHIKPFPNDYETYEFLAICDVLVCDVSSVLYDFAITKRKIILFTNNQQDEIFKQKFNMDVSTSFIPNVHSIKALVKELHKKAEHEDYSVFIEQHVPFASTETAHKLIQLMCDGTTSGLKVKHAPKNAKPQIFVYGGNLKNKKLHILLLAYIKELKKDYPKHLIVLGFCGEINAASTQFLSQLPQGVSYYAMEINLDLSRRERLLSLLTMRSMYFEKKFAQHDKHFYQRERLALCYHMDPEKVVYFSGEPHDIYRVLSTFTGTLEAHIQHNNVIGVNARRMAHQVMCSFMKEHYTQVVDHRFDDVHALWDEDRDHYYNHCLSIGNVTHIMYNTKKGLHILALCYARTILPFSLRNLNIQIANRTYEAHMHEGLHIGRGVRLTHYSCTIPYEDINDAQQYNDIKISYIDQDGYGIRKKIKYNQRHVRKGNFHHGPIHTSDTSTAAYIYQSDKNTLSLMVRDTHESDPKKERFKLQCAFYLAKLLPISKVTLLWNKEAIQGDDSVFELYEKLIDQGVNAYYVMDPSDPRFASINEKYKKNLLNPSSFKYCVIFFKAKTLVSTHPLPQAKAMNLASRCVLKKLAKQHVHSIVLEKDASEEYLQSVLNSIE